MTDASEKERLRLKDVIKKDAEETRSQLGERIRENFSRPVNLLFIALGATLVFSIDYAAERAMDAMLYDDPPQIAQLDEGLKTASAELQASATEIRGLIAEIDVRSITNEPLRLQFENLQSRLTGLTEIVERASAQTDKVAAISEALRADWERNRRAGDGRVDGVPDLILATGEAVSVCSGLASVGVVRVTTGDGTVHVKANDWTYWMNPGQRIPLDGGATLGFIGLKNDQAQMKVLCPS